MNRSLTQADPDRPKLQINHFLYTIFALVSILLCQAAMAVDPLVFSDDMEAKRHYGLSEELRCLVCQNQSLADSDAPLAMDLRREVLDLMREGMDDQEIKDYLVNRYTDFVLYRPRVNSATYLSLIHI